DAAPHDSNFIDELTAHERRIVVADCASRSREREAALAARGVTCAIAFKRQRGQKDLPPMLKRLNRMIASVRAVVEHPFAWMKNMGYRRVRYRGRRRNEVDFVLNLIAYNWKRSLSLTPTRAGWRTAGSRQRRTRRRPRTGNHAVTHNPAAAEGGCSGVPCAYDPTLT
ncbi:MAG: transposase, partial [Phycisphaerae bacterium]|nr:transposase [Phycisphaerae bacterium]